MIYCNICKKIFESNTDLKRHSTVDCSDNQSILDTVVKEKKKYKYKCHLCNKKKYIKLGHLKNHLKKCLEKEEEKKNQKNFTKQYQNIITNNNIDNRNINNIDQRKIDNRQIVINNFQFNLPGKESVKHINKERILEILKKNFPEALNDFLRLIYFNKEAPENNVWCVQYPSQEFGALRYNPETNILERWITEEVVNNKFQNMINLICPFMDEIMDDKKLYNSLSVKQKYNVDYFYRYFGVNNLSEMYPAEFRKIKMIAFNNKTVPIQLWKDLNMSLDNI